MMKGRLVCVLGAMVVLLGGCKGLSPTQKYQIAVTSYTTAVDTVTKLSRADLVTLDQLEEFNVGREEASALLDEAGDKLVKGETFNQWDLLNSILERLTIAMLKLERGEPDDGDSGSSGDSSGGDGGLGWDREADPAGVGRWSRPYPGRTRHHPVAEGEGGRVVRAGARQAA